MKWSFAFLIAFFIGVLLVVLSAFIHEGYTLVYWTAILGVLAFLLLAVWRPR